MTGGYVTLLLYLCEKLEVWSTECGVHVGLLHSHIQCTFSSEDTWYNVHTTIP